MLIIFSSAFTSRYISPRRRFHGQPPSARRPEVRRHRRLHHREGEQPGQPDVGRKKSRTTRMRSRRRAPSARRSVERLSTRTPSHENSLHVEEVSWFMIILV